MAAKYFLNCRGVFQGGGCKAVAYIGAYRRAMECGIGFTEFAGTSAGSIIAALAAAGATADEMENFLYKFDKSSLLYQEKGNWLTRNYVGLNLWIIKKTKHIKSIKAGKFSKLVAIAIDKLGVYESTFIKENVDRFLREKLGKNAEVRFSDLKYPLKIVAADLQEHRVKVWSSQKDYDFPVGKAVQCSCTFPFFFRPVDGRYVDGGVLSNLPIIFFPNKQGDIERTLAFSLKPQQEESEGDKFLDYVSSIVNTVIEGASQIQLEERQKTVVIDVETKLGLFDFEELNRDSDKCRESIQLGAVAIDKFLDQEGRNFLVSGERTKNYFTNVEQIYNQVIYFADWTKENNQIVVATKTLKWVWNLFVPLASLRKKNTKIDVYFEQYSNNGEKQVLQESRVRLLLHLGINIHVLTQGELPVYGFFFNHNNSWYGVVIDMVMSNYGKQVVYGRKLSAGTKVDSRIVTGLVYAVQSCSNIQSRIGLLHAPLIIRRLNSLNKVESKLKATNVYSRATFSNMSLEIEKLYFLTNSVHGYKYRTMQMLDSLYGGGRDYYPAEIELANGKNSLMCPLLVDEIEGKYYVIEGHVRLLYIYRNGGRIANCVVAQRTSRTITGKTFKISDLTISDKNFELGTIVALRPDKQTNKTSRGIESALRPPKNYLK